MDKKPPTENTPMPTEQVDSGLDNKNTPNNQNIDQPTKPSRRKLLITIGVVLALILISLGGWWLTTRNSRQSPQTTQQKDYSSYKLPPARTVANKSQKGPWQNNLELASSSDGQQLAQGKKLIEAAGVPSITRDNTGKLTVAYQWFPFDKPDYFDQVAVSSSTNNGQNWSEPTAILFDNYPDTLERPFDPTIVYTKEGKYRLYFTSKTTTPAAVPPPTKIYSAISDDGVHYSVEDGVRFEDSTQNVVDSSVLLLNNKYYFAAPRQDGKGYFAISDDGINFTRLGDINKSPYGSWIGNLMANGSMLRFYGGGQKIWFADYNGSAWSSPIATNTQGGDPSVIKLDDVSWLIIYVGQAQANP